MSEEKTEAPTARKKKENRKEGQVPRTQDFGGWATLLAFGMLLKLAGGREIEKLMELFHLSLALLQDPQPEKALGLLDQAFTHILIVLVLLGSVVMVIGTAAALAQGGFYLATKSVQPKLSKLSLLSGAKRMFGPTAWWEFTKTLIKSSVLGFICYGAVKSVMPMLGEFVPASTTLELTVGKVGNLLISVALAGLVMAGADYAFQRHKVGKQTRMTKQEVKQEHKNTEGDPLVKSAIRSRQLAAARNRMMADVATADVVLVNPTHVAIALKYDPTAGAPRVVARGAGEVAAKIRERAADAEVPLVRDVPLARALYGACQVGQEIPAELFAAVAQVLAYVISRRTHGHRGGAWDNVRADEDLPAVSRVRPRPRAAN